MNTAKKLLSMSLIICIILSGLSLFSAFADSIIIDNDFQFTCSPEKEISICGYVGNNTDVSVPRQLIGYDVESISDYAFINNSSITSMTLPTTLKNIGNGAFYNCTSLTRISLPVYCTNIGDYLFYGCNSLVDVSLSSVNVDVPRYCFSHCSSLKSVSLPETTKTIGDYAFVDCEELEYVYIPRYAHTISDTAFVDSPHVVIYSYLGSYAQSYAVEHNIAFSPLDAGYATHYVTYYNYDGSIFRIVEVADGADAIVPETAPIKPSTDTDYYEFLGWDGDTTNVTEDREIYPLFAEKEIEATEPDATYFVIFLNGDGTVLKAQIVKKGESATAPTEEPTKESDESRDYIFSHWDSDFSDVRDNMFVSPVFDERSKACTVTFLNGDETVIAEYIVTYGEPCPTPDEIPHKESDDRYSYSFIGWDNDITAITSDVVVRPVFEEVKIAEDKPITAPTVGALKIEITGGTSFTISVNGSAARPQGSTYMNSKMPIGATVTVTAVEVSGAEFMGWVNPADGMILTTDLSYTFTASGNDFYKATFKTVIEGVNTVTFKNDKSNQIKDMQYYAAGDEIVFPDAPNAAGWVFTGWSMTEAEIQAELTAGNDVVVLPVWERELVYVSLTVVGGVNQATGNTSDSVLSGGAVTVVADTAPAGQKFAYWIDQNDNVKSYDTTYKFYPSANTTLTAVFVAEEATIEYEVLVSVDTFVPGTYGQFYISWNVPAEGGYTYVAGGVVAANKVNYDETTFYHGTSDGNVYDRTYAKGTAKTTYAWTGPVLSGQTWVAMGWVQYRDAQNNLYTVYSDLFEATKD